MPAVLGKDDGRGLFLLWLDGGRSWGRIGSASRLLGLDLLGQILHGLLEIDEGNPADQVALLAGGLVGEGSGIEKPGLTGLRVPLDNGVNLFVGDRDLGRDTLEGGLLDGGLVVAGGQGNAGNGKEGGGDDFHKGT